MMDMSIELDGSSLAAIARLMGARARFDAETELADKDIAGKLLEAIPGQMHWQRGSGRLAGSFTKSGGNGQYAIGSSLPYSRRREEGFSGRTDSRGRHYTNDPGAFYLKAAIAVVDPVIVPRYLQAAEQALDR